MMMRMKMMNQRCVCLSTAGAKGGFRRLGVQCIAMDFNALQWIAMHCNGLQWRVLGCLMESKRMEGKLGEFVLLLPSFYFYHCIAGA